MKAFACALFTMVACSSSSALLVPEEGGSTIVIDASAKKSGIKLVVITSDLKMAPGDALDVVFDAPAIPGLVVTPLGLPDGVTAEPAVLVDQSVGHSKVRLHAGDLTPLGKLGIDLHGGAPSFTDADAPFELTIENLDGSHDASFGDDGVVTLNAFGQPVGLATFGETAFVATTLTANLPIGAIRLNDDGSVDATFASSGLASSVVAASTNAQAITIGSDGTLAISTTSVIDGGPPLGAGFVLFDPAGNALSPIATPNDAPVISVGASFVGIGPGQLEVFPSAITTALPGQFTPVHLARRNDGSILALGPYQMRRFIPQTDGSYALDPIFDAKIGGVGLAVDAQDRALVTTGDVITRITAQGDVDTTFGAGGSVNIGSTFLFATEGGTSFISVRVGEIAKTLDAAIFVLRIDIDGNLDPNFGYLGSSSTPYGIIDSVSVALTPSGKLWALVMATNKPSTLYRFRVTP